MAFSSPPKIFFLSFASLYLLLLDLVCVRVCGRLLNFVDAILAECYFASDCFVMRVLDRSIMAMLCIVHSG